MDTWISCVTVSNESLTERPIFLAQELTGRPIFFGDL